MGGIGGQGPNVVVCGAVVVLLGAVVVLLGAVLVVVVVVRTGVVYTVVVVMSPFGSIHAYMLQPGA